MITFLDGRLVSALPTQAIVDVGGVGYEVFIPLSSYDKLPAVGQPIRILTHLAVREDARALWIHERGGTRSVPVACEQRQRNRTEARAGGAQWNEREQFQSGGREFRCCVAREN